VNFVSKGGIEEGMLNVLRFKKSLFEGVLDGGEKEVFLGGSRLNKFMESVEAATAAVPAHEPQEEPREPELAAPEPEQTAAVVPAPAPTAVDRWAGLLQAGMALLQQFAGAKQGENVAQAALSGRVCRDERTGESYLRLPVPPPEVVQQAVGALQALLQ